VRIHYKLIEKEKVAGKAKREVKEEVRERIQVFEGTVLGIKGEGDNKSFIVRRIGTGKIGIERIFPLISPWIKKIDVKEKGEVRRAKLFYLRDKTGKEAEKLTEKKEEKKTKSRAKTVAKKPAVKVTVKVKAAKSKKNQS